MEITHSSFSMIFLTRCPTTPLRVQGMFDDRFSYFLTFQQCARLFAKFHIAAVSRSVGHATAWNLKKLLGERDPVVDRPL
jgi:hypothetical protein